MNSKSISTHPILSNKVTHWSFVMIISGSISLTSLLFIFQNFYKIRESILFLVAITAILAPVVHLLLDRYILRRFPKYHWFPALLLLTLAFLAAVTLVARAPESVITDPLDHLISRNPALQRLVQSESSMTVTVTGNNNPNASGKVVELGYLKSQYGDISFNQIELEGNWERTDNSLVTLGEASDKLTWRGYPGERLTLVFIGQSSSGIAEVVCGDEKQIIELYSAELRDIIVTCNFPRQYYPHLKSLFVASMVVGAALLILLLFAFLIGNQENQRMAQIIVPVFFVLYLLIGLWVYQDYGLSTDEPAQRMHGMVSTKYFLEKLAPEFEHGLPGNVPPLATYGGRNYGVAFHLPLAMFEILTDFSDISQVWLFRHYATFLFFFLGVAAFYRLAREKFCDWRLALLGTTFLILSPRIFAESFYNVKDTTFLAAFSISLLFGARFWRNPSLLNAFLFGMSAAFATNIRIIASLLVAGVVVYTLLHLARPLRQIWASTLALVGIFLVFLFLFWPASWSDPFGTFVRAFNTFSDYTRWDGMIMFRGELIRGQDAPADYLPVWITITTPLLYLVFFIIGAVATIFRGIKSGRRFFRGEPGEDLVFLALAVLPPLAAIVQGSTLYSAWRHFFFIYSPLLITALIGYRFTWAVIVRHIRLPWRQLALLSLGILTGASLFATGQWMIAFHPHQNVFISDMAAVFGDAEGFERDYWRLSVRQGLEYILANDDRAVVNIRVENWLVQLAEILPAESRARLQLTRPNGESPDFLIRTYRHPFGNYPEEIFYQIDVDGLPILTIFAVPSSASSP